MFYVEYQNDKNKHTYYFNTYGAARQFFADLYKDAAADTILTLCGPDGVMLKRGKAVYIGKCRDKNGYAVHLFYKYRGHEYMITDEHNGYSETLATKHEREQAKIDKLIEDQNGPDKPFRYEDTAEYGFDLFWDYINQEG